MKIMESLFTRADWDRLPEGFPAELIEGLLVKEPSPTYDHQRLNGWLHIRLARVVEPHLAIMAPADVVLGDYDVFQPDLVVLREAPAPHERNVGIPRIAIEILSPSTRRRDRTIKKDRLLEAGVEEVWLVDPEVKSIEIHAADGVRQASGDRPIVSRALPAFDVVPSDLFERPGS